MLTHLLALGLLGASASQASNVVTPPERTIKLAQAGAIVTAQQSIDPADRVEFVIDMTGLLATGEGVASSSFVVKPISVLLGFQIDTAPPYAPESVDAAHQRIWPLIAPGNRGDIIWVQPQTCLIEMDVTTDSTPARHFQRTCAISVVQK